jgi:hypothetical protein
VRRGAGATAGAARKRARGSGAPGSGSHGRKNVGRESGRAPGSGSHGWGNAEVCAGERCAGEREPRQGKRGQGNGACVAERGAREVGQRAGHNVGHRATPPPIFAAGRRGCVCLWKEPAVSASGPSRHGSPAREAAMNAAEAGHSWYHHSAVPLPTTLLENTAEPPPAVKNAHSWQ